MPLRKACELIMAMYGFGYGIFIWAYAVSDVNVLMWTKYDIEGAIFIGQMFAVCGLLHGFGTWLNGRFFFSPVMRIVGMVGHLLVMFSALINGTMSSGPSTAIYAYSWIALFFAIGICAAISDFIKNVKRGRPQWIQDWRS